MTFERRVPTGLSSDHQFSAQSPYFPRPKYQPVGTLRLDSGSLTQERTLSVRQEFFKLLLNNKDLKKVEIKSSVRYGKGASVKIGATRVTFYDTSGWEGLGYDHKPKRHNVIVISGKRKGLRRSHVVIKEAESMERMHDRVHIRGGGKKGRSVGVTILENGRFFLIK